jgi:hypothetical protein
LWAIVLAEEGKHIISLLFTQNFNDSNL